MVVVVVRDGAGVVRRVRAWRVVAAVADFPWCFGALECSPVTISTSDEDEDGPTAAAGPPRRRGRWLMEWMTRSSFPVMKVAGTGSGLASSNVSGLGRVGHRRRGDGRDRGWSGLGQAHRRGARDAERAGREGRPLAPSAAGLAAPRCRCGVAGMPRSPRACAAGGGSARRSARRRGSAGAARTAATTPSTTTTPISPPISTVPYSTGSAGRGTRAPVSRRRGVEQDVRGARAAGAAPEHAQEARRGRMSSGMSSRRGLLWSRLERMGSVTPQSAPTAGSSQASPCSSESS